MNKGIFLSDSSLQLYQCEFPASWDPTRALRARIHEITEAGEEFSKVVMLNTQAKARASPET